MDRVGKRTPEGGTPGGGAGAGRSARTLWTAGLALVAVLLVITRLNGGGSPGGTTIAIGAAVVLLVLRQVSRRAGNKGPKAAEPDPRSRLNLN